MYSGKHSDNKEIELITCESFAALKNSQIYKDFPLHLFAKVYQQIQNTRLPAACIPYSLDTTWVLCCINFMSHITCTNKDTCPHGRHNLGQQHGNKDDPLRETLGYFILKRSESWLAVISFYQHWYPLMENSQWLSLTYFPESVIRSCYRERKKWKGIAALLDNESIPICGSTYQQ